MPQEGNIFYQPLEMLVPGAGRKLGTKYGSKVPCAFCDAFICLDYVENVFRHVYLHVCYVFVASNLVGHINTIVLCV